MKGTQVYTIIAIILGVLILAALIILLSPTISGLRGGATAESSKNSACNILISKGCVDPGSIQIRNFDANRNKIAGDNGDTLLSLCENYYGCGTGTAGEACCLQKCGCAPTKTVPGQCSSGDCCDIKNHVFRPAGYQCSLTIVSSTCSDPSNRLVTATARYCTGTSKDCPSTSQTKTYSEFCCADCNYATKQCNPTQCTAGDCCDTSNNHCKFKTAGTKCRDASTREYCDGIKICSETTLESSCTGNSAVCPLGQIQPPDCTDECGDGIKNRCEACDLTDDDACPGKCKSDCTCKGAPIASFIATPTSGIAPLTVSFDASASHDTDGGDIVSYSWDFGDGGTITETDPTTTHTYTSAGTYTATLDVIDNDGLSDTDTKTITVSETECSDDSDNDGDGKIDMTDAGCIDANDNDETNCGDGVCEGGESCTTCLADCPRSECQLSVSCSTPADCPDQTCKNKDCVSGNCVYSNVDDGTTCGTGKFYCSGVCEPHCNSPRGCDLQDTFCKDYSCLNPGVCTGTCIGTPINEGVKCKESGSCTALKLACDSFGPGRTFYKDTFKCGSGECTFYSHEEKDCGYGYKCEYGGCVPYDCPLRCDSLNSCDSYDRTCGTPGDERVCIYIKLDNQLEMNDPNYFYHHKGNKYVTFKAYTKDGMTIGSSCNAVMKGYRTDGAYWYCNLDSNGECVRYITCFINEYHELYVKFTCADPSNPANLISSTSPVYHVYFDTDRFCYT